MSASAARILDLTDVSPPEMAPRPMMRLVESVPAPKPFPPAWMIAPVFRGDIAVNVREEQAPYRAGPAGTATEPFRSVREVPRIG